MRDSTVLACALRDGDAEVLRLLADGSRRETVKFQAARALRDVDLLRHLAARSPRPSVRQRAAKHLAELDGAISPAVRDAAVFVRRTRGLGLNAAEIRSIIDTVLSGPGVTAGHDAPRVANALPLAGQRAEAPAAQTLASPRGRAPERN